MKKKIVVAVAPATNKIFAGPPLREGIWSDDRQDVTVDALFAVAEHVSAFGKMAILSVNEKPAYKLIVEKLS